MTNQYDYPQSAPTHEEPEGMSMVRSVFERASNAIVEASRLSKEIAEIRTQLDAIKREVEEVQRRNRELDEMLTTTRQQRDEARGKLYDTERELATIKAQLSTVTDQLNALIVNANRLSDDLMAKTNDYNQAMDSWHIAEQAKEAAEAKLKDIQHFAETAFGLVRPTQSTTTPVVEPSSHIEVAQVSSLPAEDHQNERPQTEPFYAQPAGYGR